MCGGEEKNKRFIIKLEFCIFQVMNMHDVRLSSKTCNTISKTYKLGKS